MVSSKPIALISSTCQLLPNYIFNWDLIPKFQAHIFQCLLNSSLCISNFLTDQNWTHDYLPKKICSTHSHPYMRKDYSLFPTDWVGSKTLNYSWLFFFSYIFSINSVESDLKICAESIYSLQSLLLVCILPSNYFNLLLLILSNLF